jgi:hypothetical protein
MNGDNHDSEYMTFKGPFKGKGQNRKAVQLLKIRYSEVLREMEQVMEKFHEIFPGPRPVNLNSHRRRNNYQVC